MTAICSTVDGCAITRTPAAISATARTTRSHRASGSVTSTRHPLRSVASISTGRMTDATAAAMTAPAPAITQPQVRRSDRKLSQTAAAAARSSGADSPPRTSARATVYAMTIATPPATRPIASWDTVRRRSPESNSAPPTAASASSGSSQARKRTRSATRASSPVTVPTRCFSNVTGRLRCSDAATDGRTFSSASPTSRPTSASVRVTVFSSREKTARCTSRAPVRTRLPNGGLPTMPPIAALMSGRAASRSASLASTRRSVIRSPARVRTLGSRRVAVARLANCSEFSTVRWT